MQVEIEIALNFIISYLYNKLPRRRVNIFGEELEKALKHKFQGHWYPDQPVKGSAFRCFKTGDTPDPVLEIAAAQSGVLAVDILENLPHELSVWIDPGEVSYRIGEKGVIKILYSAANAPVLPAPNDFCSAVLEQEVQRTFNPEAQCFKPLESLNAAFGSMSMAEKLKANSNALVGSGSDAEDRFSNSDNSEDNLSDYSRHTLSEGSLVDHQQQHHTTPNPGTFLHRQHAPSTFTIASFAATKFGSTKLKTSSKRNNRQFSSRMSPVEFSNYIKQRTTLQQPPPFMHSPNAMMGHNGLKPLMSPSRCISPGNSHTAPALSINSDPFYFHSNSSTGTGGGFYGHHPIQQQPFLGSHYQLNGFGTASNNPMAGSSPSANAISSSVSSISSASSSSTSSSVSNSSHGEHLLFGGQFGGSNQLGGKMYDFFQSAHNTPFVDNGFFEPPSSTSALANQFDDSDLLIETNPTKFGVIGGSLSSQKVGETVPTTGELGASGNDNTGNPISGGSPGTGSPDSGSSMENLQSNAFYSGSNNSSFPPLLVAN